MVGVVAIGGSAGCIPPLVRLVRDLPAEFPAPVLVTVHTGEERRSHLTAILARAGSLTAKPVRHGEELRAGRIYVAPPGRHLLIRRGAAYLSTGPRVNRHRPAVDVMFASAADWGGADAVGVILSGTLDDGAVGSALMRQGRGRIVVQDPEQAEFSGMPQAARSAVPDAITVSTADLASTVLDALQRPAGQVRRPVAQEEAMTMADSGDPGYLAEGETSLTRLACPECGGGLARIDLPHITYFRCHVGHQYAPQTLSAAQAEATESKLWSAVAALDEQAAVQRYLHDNGAATDAQRLRRLTERATALREQVRSWTGDPSHKE